MVRIVRADPKFTTRKNLRLVRNLTNLSEAEYFSRHRILMALPVKTVPQSEVWRLRLLESCISLRGELYKRYRRYRTKIQNKYVLCSLVYAELDA